MKANIFDILNERNFIKQTVFKDDLYELLGKESVPFYVGFDPTADSLHAGHLLVLMAMSHLQRAGHKPIVLLGGGTGMIGDPSGKTDMRQFMTKEIIEHNIACFKKQMTRFIRFEGENAAVMVNNADWLLSLNYVDFLREVGVHFSVNQMLTAECFKSRMEKGLSFMEFNYMLMQGYDFLVLYQKYGCKLQCGGDDQWSNILAGADLIRRKERVPAYAMTFSLLTTSEGVKMGKTQKGAVWLDKEKTTPYEFYQYFRNVDDRDVERCLNFLTYLPVSEIREVTRFTDEKINAAKERLAYEATKIVHGEEEAEKAQSEARAAFGGDGELPKASVSKEIVKVYDLLTALNLTKSKREGKRLIEGGGIKINETVVTNTEHEITTAEKRQGIVLHKGKKIHIEITFD